MDSVLIVQSPRRQFNAAIFSPDGNSIVASGQVDLVIANSITGHLDLATSLDDSRAIDFDSAGKHFVSTFYRSKILNKGGAYVYDLDLHSGSSLLTPDRTFCTDAGFSPDGTRIVVAHGIRGLVWDAVGFKVVDSLNSNAGNESDVLNARYSPDGLLIASTGNDTTLKLWTASPCRLLRIFPITQAQAGSIRFSPDSRRILIAGDSTASVRDVTDGRLLLEVRHNGLITQANYSQDGGRIITSSSDGTARIWDASNGHLLATLLGHRSDVWSAAFSHDGTRAVTTGADSTARIWTLNLSPSAVDERGEQSLTLNLLSYPNPGGEHVQFEFSQHNPGWVRLALVDFQGHEVKRLLDEKLNAGRYIQDADISGIPVGHYMAVLYCHQGTRSTLFEVAR